MQVLLKQVKPGCILMKDVMGKSPHPIMPRNTVLEPLHIKVLSQFRVSEVEVAKQLANGEPFIPEENEMETLEMMDDLQLFFQHFNNSLKETKKLHENIKKRIPIDIVKIRSYLLPLLGELEKVQDVIFTLPQYVEEQDYPYYQAVSTAILSALIAKKMNYEHGEQIQIGIASYLSNSGMALIDEKIINKEGPLTAEEFNEIKKHPVYSYRLVEKLSMLKFEAKIGILQHHERLNGTGYPFGLSAEKIHPYARILAVSEMFIAMTADRSYKKAQIPYKVLEEIYNYEIGKLDIEVIHTLVNSLISFSVGTKVVLSNGDVGEIVFMDDRNPTRPMVRLDEDQSIIVLKDHKDIYIEKVLYGVD